ncbi:MAG: hypothetical protein KH431_04720 [Erysipelotrichaceae bacterium]|nr:hypothetical protein [Erysipelotrichaceae bacterium]
MKELTFKQNLLWNSIGSFTYLMCQWLLTLLVVRLSSDFNNAGNFALAISVTNIFYNLACFNVRQFLVSDIQNEYEVRDYIPFRIVTCAMAMILCIAYILFFNYSQSQIACIVLYMVFKIGEAVVDLFHSFEQRSGRMDIGGFSLFCRGLLSLISFFVGMRLFNNVNIAIICMIIITWIFIFTFDLHKVKGFVSLEYRFEWKKIKSLFMKFLPLTIGSFIGTTTGTLPRQLLESIHGTAALGIYGTVATPAVIVQVASSYIYNPMLVSFAKYRKNAHKKEFTALFLKTSGIILLLSIICLIGSYLFAEWGLTLLYGSEVGHNAYLFIPVIIYTSLNGFQWFYSSILVVFRCMKSLLVINFISFLICILTARSFISNYGMNGVSYVLICFTFVMIVLMVGLIIYQIRNMKTLD